MLRVPIFLLCSLAACKAIAWQALDLHLCSDDELEELTVSADTETAIFAAWEQSWRERDQQAKERMAWFVGFLKGRIRSPIGSFWTKYLEDGYFLESRKFELRDPAGRQSWFGTENSLKLSITRGFDFVESDGRTFIQHIESGLTIPINRKRNVIELNNEDFSLNLMAICPDGDDGIILAFASSSGEYPIFRLNKLGDVVWTSTVLETDDDDNDLHAGMIHSQAEITCGESLVVVFGLSYGNLFIQAFDKNTGSSRFLFSLEKWSQNEVGQGQR